MSTGVVLSGPPAAGKDTVTGALIRLDPRFALFPVLKAGPGRRHGYAMTTRQDIDARPGLLWRIDRYGATYAVARSDLARATSQGWPVVHCGNPAAVESITGAGLGPWLTVSLWCPRDIAVERLTARSPHDLATRLAAWDATPRIHLDVDIDTSRVSPDEAARQIRRHATG